MATTFTIVMPVFDGVDLLDLAGAREMFFWAGQSSRFPEGLRIVQHTVANAPMVTTQDGLTIRPSRRFDSADVQAPQMIWVPGGSLDALPGLLSHPDGPFFQYVLRVGRQADLVASVCEGALLLAKTGLLDGFRATTHWLFYPCLETYPEVEVVPPSGPADDLAFPHYVWDERDGEKRVTGGGVSSGLDEALSVIQTVWGEAVAEDTQRSTQYFPNPPVSATLSAATGCPIAMPDTPQTQPRG